MRYRVEMVHVPGPGGRAADLPGRRVVTVFKVIAGATVAGGFDLQVLTEQAGDDNLAEALRQQRAGELGPEYVPSPEDIAWARSVGEPGCCGGGDPGLRSVREVRDQEDGGCCGGCER